MVYIFCSVPCYNIFVKISSISCLFSGGMTLSSTLLEFASDTAALWTTFLEAVFAASSPYFAAVSKYL